jgi:CO/xanthine dehydrogenase Mo-binding subunit
LSMTRYDILKIGKAIPRPDAWSKVQGQEKYAADYYGDDLVWAGAKRAGVSHAHIRSIHTGSARKVPGVIAVLTSKDILGSNRQGVVRKDQPVLADDRIRHCGDPVALVLAERKEALQEALGLISIDMDLLPAIFDPEEAMEEGAVLIHEDNPGGNVLLKGELKTGSGEAAFEECDVTVEARFELPCQEHAYLETEVGWALFKEDGSLDIVASTQTPFRDRSEVADALGLDREKVRIIAPYCGGAFGGKDGVTVQGMLGLAALNCPGRPVKMWWDREESFLAGVKRHSARLHYRLGAKADGTLHALRVRICYDTGPYDSLGGVVAALGLEHAGGPYRIPNVSLKSESVYTNNPVGGAFRGFGVPQVTAAMEQTLDLLAARLKLSPLDIRLVNAVKRGDKNPVGVTLSHSTGLQECLDTLAKHPIWQEREKWKSSAGPFKPRGAGIACVMQGMGYGPVVPDSGNAKIELDCRGKFRVFCGVVDMGQGNAGTYLQIAGTILNQDSEHMEAVLPDTAKTLPSGSATASRTTYTFGNALIGAAQLLKNHILGRAADLFMVDRPDEMEMAPGRILHLPTGRDISLSEMACLLNESERVAVYRFRAPVAAERPTEDPNLRLHGLPHCVFSYGVHLACVEVDEITGKVETKQYLAVSDCGRIINPQIFEQQIQGGIAQGLGYALYEDLRVEKGRIETPNLSTYIIPGSLDIPDMDSVPVELGEETGPFGLKGAGEVAMDGPLPAVANAVADACGIRIFRSPLTAERVLQALAEKGSREKLS